MLSSRKSKSPCSSPDDARKPPSSPLSRRPSRYISSKPSRHDLSEEGAVLPRVVHDPRPPKRPSICAFLTLPPISASPMCTPTSSVSSPSPVEPLSATDSGASASTDTHTLSCASDLLIYDTPTWIATPPTPPSKPLRRSKTTRTVARQVALTPFIPSASFPALMQPHASSSVSIKLKRCVSLPTLPLRSIPLQEPSSTLDASKSWQRAQAMSENLHDATFSFSHSIEDLVGRSSSRPPMFHLNPSEPPSDADDDSTYIKSSISVASHADSNAEDLLADERRRDAHRRYHALRELLTTELGYLSDLRALVTVYLRQLSSLTHRPLTSSSTISRASASFASGPWLHSYTQFQAAAAASTDGTASIPSSHSKDTPKSNHRPIFDGVEQDVLLRNSEDLLQLHESFVQELRQALRSLGVCMDTMEADDVDVYLPHLEDAILCVATKFATEASRFNMYQGFCAGHSEAVDLARKAMQQYPLDFETFESRSALLVSEIIADDWDESKSHSRPPTSRSSSDPPIRSLHLATEDRKRAMSLTSLDGAPRPQSLRPRASMVSMVGPAAIAEPKREKQPIRRIAFLDYLIKPIQRICKYPLLIDQLLSSKRLRELEASFPPKGASDVNVVVESAAQAMRHVAALVDEARHRQDIAVQSSLISARIFLHPSPSPMPYPTLSSSFIASLGTCHLAGSLDAIHYHPTRPISQTSNIKAKYLGAFLYLGGYLILVKVSKGKKYEPRHWMSLADFEVVDVEDDTATLPCSFKLVSPDQHFEFAAACKREKDTWLRSIRESLAHTPSWTNEPIPSYRLDSKGEILPNPDDNLNGSTSGHSTIPSIPEQVQGSDTDYSEPFFSSLRSASRPRRARGETPLIQKQETPTASRRSSSNSVKAIFSPMTSGPETVVIRRSSALARHQVDQELQDVISRSCLTARTHAFTNEEELFQPPKDGFARSGSTMSMARLSKHESVRIPRRRTLEAADHLHSSTPSSSRSSSMTRRNTKNLHLSVISPNSSDKIASPSPSPPPSQPSSRTPSLLSSGSGTSNISFPSASSVGSASPARQRSTFVRNVKGLFHFRPGSPSPSASLAPGETNLSLTESPSPPPSAANTQGPVHHHRWRWESHRRRPKSVHDEPISGAAVAFEGPEQQPFPTAPSALAMTSLSS